MAIGRWLAAIATAAATLVLSALIAPHVPVPEAARIVGALLAFGAVGAQVVGVSALTPALGPRWLAALPVPVGLLALVAVLGDALAPIAAAALVTAGLLGLGTLVGAVVGGLIERPGYLLVVAIVSALVDAFSVLHPAGPTAQLVEIEAAVNVLLLPFPLLGTDRIEPLLGVGDVAFAALYCVASRRHGLSLPRTAAALAVSLAVTLAVVLATGRGVPALPFLGAAVVLAHPRARRVPPEDRAKATVGVVAIACVLGALAWLRA